MKTNASKTARAFGLNTCARSVGSSTTRFSTAKPSLRPASKSGPTLCAPLLIFVVTVASRFARGATSRISSTRLTVVSSEKTAMPVTFRPGLARLLARPEPTGSTAVKATIGIASVALWAARAAGVLFALWGRQLPPQPPLPQWPGGDQLHRQRPGIRDGYCVPRHNQVRAFARDRKPPARGYQQVRGTRPVVFLSFA